MNKKDHSQEAFRGSASGHEAVFAEFEKYSQQHGQVLFQGRWMTPGQVKRHYRWLRLRSWWMLLEVMGLLVVLLAGVGLMWLLVLFKVGL